MSSKSFFARAAQRDGRKGKAGLIVKRVRPPMPPLAVRVQVAERQFLLMPTNDGASVYNLLIRDMSQSRRLQWLLYMLFRDGRNETAPHALDHDPALILRKYNPRIKDVAARYTPHAHDPDALIYREKADHQQKTTGRKHGATHTATTLGSDIHLKTKFARLERKEKEKQTRADFAKHGPNTLQGWTDIILGKPRPIKSRGFAKGPKRKMQSRGFR